MTPPPRLATQGPRWWPCSLPRPGTPLRAGTPTTPHRREQGPGSVPPRGRPTPLHNPGLRHPEGHPAVGGVVLHALDLGLQRGDVVLVSEQEDAFALVGGGGLADPRLGFCGESRPSPRRPLTPPLPPLAPPLEVLSTPTQPYGHAHRRSCPFRASPTAPATPTQRHRTPRPKPTPKRPFRLLPRSAPTTTRSHAHSPPSRGSAHSALLGHAPTGTSRGPGPARITPRLWSGPLSPSPPTPHRRPSRPGAQLRPLTIKEAKEGLSLIPDVQTVSLWEKFFHFQNPGEQAGGGRTGLSPSCPGLGRWKAGLGSRHPASTPSIPFPCRLRTLCSLHTWPLSRISHYPPPPHFPLFLGEAVCYLRGSGTYE